MEFYLKLPCFQCVNSGGIGIYWIAGSVIRCIQQLIINKHLDNMDLEDYIRKNQAKAAKKREKSGLPPQKITQQAKQ